MSGLKSAALFKPFRALGYITDDVPFAIQRRGKETFVTVSVGRAWQIYNTNKITLALVGPQLRYTITALACKNDFTFAACGSIIVVCKRVTVIAECVAHTANIIQLLSLGDQLLSLGRDGQLVVWKLGEWQEPERVIRFPEGFTPSCFCHPDTYLNKVLVGSEEGTMQLYNFVTKQLLYTFPGWGSPVCCLVPSSALDVIGVGLADGRVVLHHIRQNHEVMVIRNAAGLATDAERMVNSKIRQDVTGAPGAVRCSCISFRTGAGVPLMAAGGGAGVITVWNLEERRLHTIIRDAHDGPLVRLHFFAGEPLLMSAASDNSLKQWLFDQEDNSARLLKFRSGHSAPPTCIAYYGGGLRLLSAGEDRAFRMFSTIQDQQSRELSQHHTAKRAKKLRMTEQEVKLSSVVALAASEVRERDWCNVLTAHEGDCRAYTWKLQHFTLGDQKLTPPRDQRGSDAAVTCVAISPCGNFGLVGNAWGRIDRYNMQSGLHRGTYWRQVKEDEEPAHQGSVVGLAVDLSNKVMVSSGKDGQLRTWSFKKLKMLEEMEVGCPMTRLCLHAGSNLCAVAREDHIIEMYDVEWVRRVRRFSGHTESITCITISGDCRWLLSSAMDATIRIWDIPAAQSLQVMSVGVPVTCLSLTPGGDMLATTHVGRRGIFLWSNTRVFEDGSAVDAPAGAKVVVGLPSITSGHRSWEDGDDEETCSEASSADVFDAGKEDSHPHDMEVDGAQATTSSAPDMGLAHRQDNTGAPAPLDPLLVTLSLLPRSQWEHLVHLETIKARNKPLAPPKKPQQAPFFLPTIPSLSTTPVFARDKEAQDEEEDADAPHALQASRVVRSHSSVPTSSFLQLLRQCYQHGKSKADLQHKEEDSPVGRSDSEEEQDEDADKAEGAEHEAPGSGGPYQAVVAMLRTMSPATIERELRSMEVLEGASEQEIVDLEALLDCIHKEVAATKNFEFMQALLQVVLQIHAEAIMSHERLRNRCAALRLEIKRTWKKLEHLLQSTRCMISYFGNLQT